MKIKKTKITDTPSGSLVPLNSKRRQQEAEAFCYSLLIKGTPEAKLLSDFQTEYPNCDFIKAISRANAAFELVARQPEAVIVGKAIAQLDYQLAKANSAGDINSSINAIKTRTEIFRRYNEKKISDEKNLTDFSSNWL